jgi:hypothetical protein
MSIGQSDKIYVAGILWRYFLLEVTERNITKNTASSSQTKEDTNDWVFLPRIAV